MIFMILVSYRRDPSGETSPRMDSKVQLPVCSFGTFHSLGTFDLLGTFHSLRSFDLLGTFRSLRAFDLLGPVGTLRSLRAFSLFGPLAALRSLSPSLFGSRTYTAVDEVT
ncbi:MAG: hypothetical protein JRC77_07480, partial [Deltaproteobacteria bacterium]|nr:hypothetical protein [Deltaproteobacteria bacterium]